MAVDINLRESIKREFSTAETDAEIEECKGGASQAVDDQSIVVSSPSLFGIELDDSDPNYLANLRLVAYSSVGGSLILVLSAVDHALAFDFLSSLLFIGLAIALPVFGYRGAKNQKTQAVAVYSYICLVLAIFQCLSGCWKMAMLMSTVFSDNSGTPSHIPKKSLAIMRGLEALLAFLCAVFWGIASYFGATLHKNMAKYQLEKLQRQQRNLILRATSTSPSQTLSSQLHTVADFESHNNNNNIHV